MTKEEIEKKIAAARESKNEVVTVVYHEEDRAVYRELMREGYAVAYRVKFVEDGEWEPYPQIVADIVLD